MAVEEPAPIVVVAPPLDIDPLDSVAAVVDVTAVHVDVRVPGPSSSSLALLLADKSDVKVSLVGASGVLFKWQMRTTIF